MNKSGSDRSALSVPPCLFIDCPHDWNVHHYPAQLLNSVTVIQALKFPIAPLRVAIHVATLSVETSPKGQLTFLRLCTDKGTAKSKQR